MSEKKDWNRGHPIRASPEEFLTGFDWYYKLLKQKTVRIEGGGQAQRSQISVKQQNNQVTG